MEDQGLVTMDTSAGRRVFSLTDEVGPQPRRPATGRPPWEDVARSANRSLVDLRGLMSEVAAATMQVARAGSESQVKSVADILAETRRRIYLVLAEEATPRMPTPTPTPTPTPIPVRDGSPSGHLRGAEAGRETGRRPDHNLRFLRSALGSTLRPRTRTRDRAR